MRLTVSYVCVPKERARNDRTRGVPTLYERQLVGCYLNPLDVNKTFFDEANRLIRFECHQSTISNNAAL